MCVCVSAQSGWAWAVNAGRDWGTYLSALGAAAASSTSMYRGSMCMSAHAADVFC